MDLPETSWHELPVHTRCSPALILDAGATLQEAAAAMQTGGHTAVLVQGPGRLEGILTDKDLRRAVASGAGPRTDRVSGWMCAPVRTFSHHLSTGAAQAAMLRFGISHLVLTEDGMDTGKVVGMVSQRDILITQSHSPAMLMRGIREAADPKDLLQIGSEMRQLLTEYMRQELPVSYSCEVFTALKDALVSKWIGWEAARLGLEHLRFCWLATGSLGRGEQLLPTDQDNALVFEDLPGTSPQDTRERLLPLARAVNDGLAAMGYAPCPAGMMASNPRWCLSVSEWKSLFTRWIREPDEDSILVCSAMLDMRPVWGDTMLEEDIMEQINLLLGEAPPFLSYLAVSALNAPPAFGFFGQLRKEGSGEHGGYFDLKARGLLALVDAARLLVLSRTTTGFRNTEQRFRFMAKAEPQNQALFEGCAQAFLDLSAMRVQSGLARGDSGRYMDLKALSPYRRKQLKAHLRTVAQLRQLIEVRFRVAGLR